MTSSLFLEFSPVKLKRFLIANDLMMSTYRCVQIFIRMYLSVHGLANVSKAYLSGYYKSDQGNLLAVYFVVSLKTLYM